MQYSTVLYSIELYSIVFVWYSTVEGTVQSQCAVGPLLDTLSTRASEVAALSYSTTVQYNILYSLQPALHCT